MSLTEKISTRIARQIRVEESPYTVGQISHGIEIALLFILNITALMLASFILGLFVETTLITAIYIVHRSFTNGIHMKSPWTCIAAGVLTILATAFLAKSLTNLEAYGYLLVFGLFFVSFFINFRYAPAGHTYVKTDDSIKQLCRKIILTLLFCGCIICMILIYFNQLLLAHTYTFAVFLQSLHLHPLSFRMVARFEQIWKEG